MMKRCRKCGEEKPATAEFFYKDTRRKDGLKSCCKPCTNEQSRVYRAANVDVIKEKARAYNAANVDVINEKARAARAADPEKHREKRRAYHAANIDVISEQNRAWRVANAEALSERKRAYQVANPEICKASAQRYEARKRELPATLTAQEWQYAVDYFHGCCAVCGRPLKDLFATHTAAADHWLPLSKGGGTTAGNIVPLCHGKDGCNNRKNNVLPEAWLVRQFGKREAKKILVRIQTYFASIEE